MTNQSNQTSFQNRNSASWIEKILWFCSASDVDVLETCSGQTRKFHSLIGIFVILTSTFAWFSAIIAVRYLFDGNSLTFDSSAEVINVKRLSIIEFLRENNWVIVVALVWGFLIFSIDRFLISTIFRAKGQFLSEKSPVRRFFQNFFAVSLRLIMAFGIAFSISALVELQIFDKAIAGFSVDDYEATLTEAKTETGYEATIESTNSKTAENLSKSGQIAVFLQENTKFSKRRVFRRYFNIKDHPKVSTLYSNAVKCDNNLKTQTIPIEDEIKKLENEIKIHDDAATKINDPLNVEFWEIIVENGIETGGKRLNQKRVDAVISAKNAKIESLNLNLSKIEKNCSPSWVNASNVAQTIIASLQNDKSALEAEVSSNVILVDSLKRENKILIKNVQKSSEGKSAGIAGKFNMLHKMLRDPENRSNLWLAIFLFTLFFIIEILPVMGKFLTPISGYDYKVAYKEWREEKEALYLKDKYDKEIEIKKSQMKQFVEDLKTWNRIS